MDPKLRELLRAEGSRDDQEIEAIIRLRDPGVDVPGARIVSRFGPIVTCRLTIGSIHRVRGDDNVLALNGSLPLGEEDRVRTIGRPASLPVEVLPADVRRPADIEETGEEVCLGVGDFGFDFRHPNFKRADGTTRLLALWDQRASGPGHAPHPYGYGRVYSRAQINAALRTDAPYDALGYDPSDADRDGRGAHGTCVTDVAAGNGRAGGPVGIAPDASLVCVHLTDRGTSGLANLADSVPVLEAVDYIAATAGERPWVINLSVGRSAGPHDPCTPVQMALDHLLSAAPNRCVIHSGGNYFDRLMHASGRLETDDVRSLTLIAQQGDVTTNELEAWYSGEDEFRVMLQSPTGAQSQWVVLGSQADVFEDDQLVGRIYHIEDDPYNHDNQIEIFLYPWAPAGRWIVTLHAVSAPNGVFHAWIERDEACGDCQARFHAADADSSSTTGTLANGRLPLVVGAYDAHSPTREVAAFSSCGPTRDGRSGIDVLAPGAGVLAARSAPRDSNASPGLHARKDGTSFAAPHVAGAVALMLEAAGRPLWIEEIRALLLSSAQRDTSGPIPSPRSGWGRLDIAATLRATLALAPNTPPLGRPSSYTNTDQRDDEMRLAMTPDVEQAEQLSFDPDTVYRTIAYGRDGSASAWIDDRYTVIARPGETPSTPPAAGDVLISVALGEPGLGRVALLTDDAPMSPRAAFEGTQIRVERGGPGSYGVVVDRCTAAGETPTHVARQILNRDGVMPHGRLLLRSKSELAINGEDVFDEGDEVDTRKLDFHETFDAFARTIRKVETIQTDKGDPKIGRKPSVQEVYWVEFKVNADGVMTGSARTVSSDRRLRSPRLKLGAEFSSAVKRFKGARIDVKAFDADWSYMKDAEPSTNLKMFEDYLKRNPKASRADAARTTPSGKIAIRAGFTEVSVGDTKVEADPDIGPGKYPRVRARFALPGVGPLPGAPTSGNSASGSPTPPPTPGAGSTTTTTRRVKAGAALTIMAANVGLNWIIEAKNEERMRKALARLEPDLRKEQQQYPTMGFLLVFRFSGARQSPDGPSASGRFEGVSYRRAYTRSEAEANWKAEPRMDPNQSFLTEWIGPAVAPSPRELQTPFEKVALAKFTDITSIRFQKVEFAEWGGFDENGTEGLNASKFRTEAEGYRFLVLKMPSEIRHYNINGHVKTKSIDVEEREVKGGKVPVLMLDDDPAVTVWPADVETAKLFNATRGVDDKDGKLDINRNIHIVRWLRPAQVQILQHFKNARPPEVITEFADGELSFVEQLAGDAVSARTHEVEPSEEPASTPKGLARKIWVVMTDDWMSLPTRVRSEALNELTAVFAFVGKAHNQRPFVVFEEHPDRLPQIFDFSEAVVSVIKGGIPSTHVERAMDLQERHIDSFLRGQQITRPRPAASHAPQAPDRIGAGGHHKRTETFGDRRFALPVMAGAISLNVLVDSLIDDWIDDAISRKLRARRTTLEKWEATEQTILGKTLGRGIAHEARHQYLGGHAQDGLGADEVYLWGEKGGERFSVADQAAILARVKLLEKQQGTDIGVPTFPGSARNDASLFPF